MHSSSGLQSHKHNGFTFVTLRLSNLNNNTCSSRTSGNGCLTHFIGKFPMKPMRLKEDKGKDSLVIKRFFNSHGSVSLTLPAVFCSKHPLLRSLPLPSCSASLPQFRFLSVGTAHSAHPAPSSGRNSMGGALCLAEITPIMCQEQRVREIAYSPRPAIPSSTHWQTSH